MKPTFAESVLIQADGDLSDSEFRTYIRQLAVQETSPIADKITIEHGLAALGEIKSICDEVFSDYEMGKNDPENECEGFKPTDPIEELVLWQENEDVRRALIRLGLSI